MNKKVYFFAIICLILEFAALEINLLFIRSKDSVYIQLGAILITTWIITILHYKWRG